MSRGEHGVADREPVRGGPGSGRARESSPAFDPDTVPVREAATVVLVRDDADQPGLEVFLQHRVDTMVFAAGMTVFPGGGVEDRDRTPQEWSGPDIGWWAERFAVSSARAHAAVWAAGRELFEETGVVLAEPAGNGPTRTPHQGERSALDAGESDFASLLNRHGLLLSAHLLRPWDRWTTPIGPPRRYDTLFFVAELPRGTRAPDGENTESRSSGWMGVDDVLRAGREGRVGLLPPTVAVLTSLSGLRSTSNLPAEGRRVPPGGH